MANALKALSPAYYLLTCWNGRGTVGSFVSEKGNVKLAIQYYSMAIELRPGFCDAWSNLAGAYMRKGRLEEAAQCCRHALALNPKLVDAQSNFGNLFKAQGLTHHVDQSTVGIKERFGRFEDVLEPGCHCVPWYCGINVAGLLSLCVQQLGVRCETNTKDAVSVVVVASVQYRAVKDSVYDAFYKLKNPKKQIQQYVFDVVRASVPKMILDEMLAQKSEIAKNIESELEKAMSAYGYEIIQTLIVDIELDESVSEPE